MNSQPITAGLREVTRGERWRNDAAPTASVRRDSSLPREYVWQSPFWLGVSLTVSIMRRFA
jgi:hypothetical protein